MMNYTLCDAHAHLGGGGETDIRIKTNIPSLISTTSPEEWKLAGMYEATNSDIIIPTFGIHPWNAGKYQLEEVKQFLESCQLIGEIGMDSVWCDVPLSIQEQVFREQLAMASALKKPVILHTKGCEKQIAAILREYENLYLVHWYSNPQFLECYLELNCYFTVGPDIFWNPAVKRVVLEAPVTRLLTETDGMDAVKWAYEEAALQGFYPTKPPVSVKAALRNTLKAMAELLGQSEDILGKQIEDNFYRLLNGL